MLEAERLDRFTVAERIFELRHDRKLTVEAFADALGVRHSTASNWMNLKATPNADALFRIASYFEVTVDWLLGVRTNSPKHPAQWRTSATLAEDVAAHVLREVYLGLDVSEAHVRNGLDDLVNGEDLLAYLTRGVTVDLAAEAAYIREMRALLELSTRARVALAAGQTVEIVPLHDELLMRVLRMRPKFEVLTRVPLGTPPKVYTITGDEKKGRSPKRGTAPQKTPRTPTLRKRRK